MIAKAKTLLFIGIAAAAVTRGFAVTSVSLIWDPSPSAQAVGYKLYCMMSDGSGKLSYDVGNTTNAVVENLVEGQTYHFYATAYDSDRNESGPSDTLIYTVPSGGPSPNGATAKFVMADTATRGDWKGRLGSEGYWLAAVPPAIPSFANVTTSASQWTWSTNTTQRSALQDPGESTNRLAACWYSSTQVSFDLTINDAKSHRVSMYFWDASASGRQQRVDLVDRDSGAILDSRAVTNFSSGIYFTWEIAGKVVIRLTPSNVNAVTSAIFFDPTETNRPPVLASIPDQLANEGQMLQFTASGSDPDSGQTLSYALANAPAGATIDKDSGVFSWTPQSGQAPSTNTATISVTDNGPPSLSSSRTFNIIVREGFYLTLDTSPNGTAQVNPRGSLNTQGTKYVAGTTVSATATAANGYKFHHWTLDGATYTENPISFTMNSNHTLKPSFTRGNLLDTVLLVGE